MRFEIDASLDGLLIREFLRQTLGMSGSLVKHLKFAETGILVNGKRQNVRYTLRAGDVLDLAMEDTEEEVSPYVVPAELPIEVVYEDDDLTVVNKPYDMPSHPSRGHPLDTVANALAYLHREETYVFRPVNRLDRDTSGLMVTANSRLSAYKACRLMIAGKVRKTYLAVLVGELPTDAGLRSSYIRRTEPDAMKRMSCETEEPEAKKALTAYRVLARADGVTLVVASPLTGRTHQLRVHFSDMGCPILGDSLYGQESPEIPRQALHAVTLQLPQPSSGQLLHLTARVPEDMRTVIQTHFGKEAERLISLAEHTFFDELFGGLHES